MHNQERIELRRLHPSVLMAVLLLFLFAAISQADADRSHGLLWEISKPDTSPSWLFGTIHSEDADVVTLAPPVQQAFDDAGTVVLEILMDEEAMKYSANAMLMLDGRLLPDIVGQSLYERLAPLMEQRGIPAPLLNRMKPWAVAVTLSVPPQETGQILDLTLYQSALQQGKQLAALETMQEQLELFDSLAEADQVALLKDAVDHYPQLDALYREMLTAWRARDLGALMRINESYQAQGNAALAETIQRRVIDDRNRHMAERARPLLEAGDAFIAVGALHLPGETGLLELLEQQGYRIRRVY